MIFASIVGALIILAVLSWRDLNERTRSRLPRDLQGDGDAVVSLAEPREELPRPAEGLTPRQITWARKLYVIAFWIGIGGNLLLPVVGLLFPGVIWLLNVATIALLLVFIGASFRILQVLGHDGLTSALLCLLLLVPFFSLVQYIGLSRRCRLHWGPLAEVPGE